MARLRKCTERLELRCQPVLRSIISEAAAREGVSVGAFVRQAAIEKLQDDGLNILQIHTEREAA